MKVFLWRPQQCNGEELCAGASPTAGDQGEGERADSVLSEAERGPEGHQSQISGKGAVVTFFQTNISFRLFQWFYFFQNKTKGMWGSSFQRRWRPFSDNFYSLFQNNISFFLPEECQGQALGDDWETVSSKQFLENLFWTFTELVFLLSSSLNKHFCFSVCLVEFISLPSFDVIFLWLL